MSTGNPTDDGAEGLFARGAVLFDAGHYFAAHDVWEELWTGYRGPLRNFYKGLIQSAVALYHYSRGNLHGARKLWRSSTEYLRPFAPLCRGLDVDRFLAEHERCFADVMASDAPQPLAQRLPPRFHPPREGVGASS
ncbi:hypothetical protein Pla175_35340 [Pirellulimonas nuda]|uniref:DUF309 domain-containing protein n=1 Tax=Pirellulimonas nuda TaxID=2528009 RepID=A0A518DF77_9BACT|nr:DUF309 domain-containing protein [Pirellulimonas nuda]QDU90133.1 hypothetical protein Pla175_35340 [Pirellulimonas nuda]